MRSAKTNKDMYAAQGRRMPQRIFMTLSIGAGAGVAWWLLLGHGIEWAGAWFGRNWREGDEARRLCLGIAFTIYLMRVLLTVFVFLKRAMSWSEAGLIAGWALLMYLALAFAGGTNTARFAAAGITGCALFVLGSWMNSYAEYARHVWKQREENRGRLYTRGLFRFSRHPNYLGDLISFSGLCLISGRWPTFAIPAIMLGGFVFANIPMLDSHLHNHYGAAFDAYAARTRKLIPFVY